MKRRLIPRVASWKCLVALAMVAALSASWAVGAEAGAATAGEKSEAKKTRKAAGRLPTYYAQVVDDEQRGKIVAILDDYALKLAALTKERDEKVQAVLTPEQLKKIEDLKAAAKTKRQSGKQTKQEAAAREKPPAKEPASPKRGKKSSE